MAGVAENIQVVSNDKSAASVFDGELSPTDLTFDLSGTDNASLQELIDSELALRIGDCLRSEPDAEDVPPVRSPLDPSERFIEVEKCHTAATLNVFSDTIDLSPTSDFVPFPPCALPQEDITKSPDLSAPENIFSSGSDDSPITEDLEPIPLFTQTVTSDHEQSPLTEVNPFVVELGSDKDPPIDEVLVVIEPPDDATPVSDSPDRVFSPVGEITVEEIDSGNLVDISDPQLVAESDFERSVPIRIEFEDFNIETEHQTLLDLDDQPVLEPEANFVEIEKSSFFETLVETENSLKADPESPVEDDVDASVSVCNSMPVVSNPVCSVDSEWTTVEDATKEIQSCETTELSEPQDHQDLPLLHNNVTESITTSTTTKTVKKKKSIEGGDATSTRTKKTKKIKKSEEKENHISVMTNGHHSSPEDTASPTSPVSPTPLDDDELSNVCVRDLKKTYVREAAKSTSVTLKVPSEEPVSSPVSIRELRRSFCDLQQACESPEAAQPQFLASVPSSQLKAQSLGDLRRLADSPQLKHIHTGVSVKALAASYWSLVSREPTTPPLVLTPPPNKNVAHTLKKSSFSKFDQLQKKTILHVRSSDASKIQKQFNQETPEVQGANPTCKSCGKTVFAMEQVKAERSVWHKNCFRCKECSKQLTVDIYQSHEGELYCKPHFKELFKPKAVLENPEDEPLRRRKPEMIIRENQPVELPPEVFRASDKADLGLEELSSLNVKSRYQVFEKTSETEVERSPSTVNVKRSPSILSKLAKFQKKGMDVGVPDETLNGVGYEESSSSEDEAQGEEGSVVKSSKLPERPVSFNKMEDVKRTWESSGAAKTREELRAEQKKEISQIRSRLFQGKQCKMKEMYEQAVADSEGKVSSKKDQDVVQSEKARLLKERFERGEIVHSESEEDEEKKGKNKDVEDMSVFEAGISKKSRSIFLELDASAAKTQSSPLTPPVHTFTPRTTERRASNTAESPDREIYRDPEVVRSEDTVEDETIVKRSQTASRMLSLFRQMEEQKEEVPDGPKPLKCFTPPPDYKEDQSGSSEEEDEESEEEEESEDDTGIVRASDKIEDEFLKQAQNAAKAKALKEKFEHWEPEKQSVNNAINLLDSEQESIESTKSLRARFESLKAEQPKEKLRPKVNRFVLQEQPAVTKCVVCDKIVYPLEKVEVDSKTYHGNCFRCQQCQCKLRMDSYTQNNDNLYCLPHFRQLFIAKGNYDEGFGSDQHKRKWESTASPVNGH